MPLGIAGILVYLDDILVCGRDQSEHDACLNNVLTLFLDECGFRLCLENCKFNSPSVKYLGFFILANGSQPDPAQIQPIRSMRAPENTKELRSFRSRQLLREIRTESASFEDVVRCSFEE